jgi:hypothetical protein
MIDKVRLESAYRKGIGGGVPGMYEMHGCFYSLSCGRCARSTPHLEKGRQLLLNLATPYSRLLCNRRHQSLTTQRRGIITVYQLAFHVILLGAFEALGGRNDQDCKESRIRSAAI